jgi:hypothetical protein
MMASKEAIMELDAVSNLHEPTAVREDNGEGEETGKQVEERLFSWRGVFAKTNRTVFFFTPPQT